LLHCYFHVSQSSATSEAQGDVDLLPYGGVRISWRGEIFRYFFDHSYIFALALLEVQHLKNSTDLFGLCGIATVPLSAFKSKITSAMVESNRYV